MAPVVAGSGTQTATLGTEHVLHTQSTAKTCVLTVDLTNLVGVETVELRIYNKTLTGDTITPGTTLPLYPPATFTGPQDTVGTQSVPVIVAYNAQFTLKQTGGTGRAFKWTVCTLD